MCLRTFRLDFLVNGEMVAFFDKYSKAKSTKTSKIHPEFAYFAHFLRVLLVFIKFTPLNEKYPPGYRGVLYFGSTYRFRINFCSAWICLLIDAINATIDFRTSALDVVSPPILNL